MTESRCTATPGRWDHWPRGFLATLAAGKGVIDRAVMDVDDRIFPLMQFVETPVEFLIKDGVVIEINGSADADRLKEFIASYDDPRARAISQIGWGLNERSGPSTSLASAGTAARVTAMSCFP